MLCERHNRYTKEKLSFRDILFDGNNWEEYKQNNNPCWYVIEAVEKFRQCRTGELGYTFWYCERCGFGGVSPHSCKSKLCSSCATIATKEWLAEVIPTLLDVKYFQIVFTLPPALYPLFICNKEILYNRFFRIAADTILLVGASLHLEPGAIAALHPFGSKYNPHPHLHLMVTAGGLTFNHKGWFPITSWPLEKTREVFKALLYQELRKLVRAGEIYNPYGSLGEFERILQKLYPKDWNLFIEYKDRESKAKYGLSYIARYTKRAIIPDRKLISYDGENVTFKAKTQTLTLPKAEFIKRVLQHIMPKNFRTTRFYGIYANTKKKKLVPLAQELAQTQKIEAPPRLLSWRERRKKYSGVDPLTCPRCGNELTLIAVTYSSYIPQVWKEILSLSIFDHFL